ncbi:sodium-coupled monocarboxylate transporter 1 [Parasteatoda tepidariorum]
MLDKKYLGITDYIVICSSLLISVGIGITSRLLSGGQKTAKEYILAGKNMKRLPVILSIIVTLVSPSTMLAVPAEIYKYGFVFVMSPLAFPIGVFLASWIFIPVYFQCGVSTIYEFLEIRFGRMTRYIVSILFLVQMMFYMVICLYGSVLALSAVTDISLEISMISLGIICTIYCSIGGLRAVLWTDVFQAMLIILCLVALYAVGIKEAGGIADIYIRSRDGGRLNDLFDLRLNFTKRLSFWGSFCRGIMFGISYYGTNQVEVQRVLSLSTSQRAKSTLQMSILPMTLVYVMNSILGVILYSIYYKCDPILNKNETGVERYDQIVPAYIINTFNWIPGMTGLCIAGLFSAALSTISSCLNSIASVTVVDIIKPLYRKGNMSDKQVVWCAKILSLVYGGICIALSFCFIGVKSFQQLAQVLISSQEGPMLAVFIVGVLTTKASDKCVSFALIAGYSLMSCISFGALFSNYTQPPLPLSTEECIFQNVTNHGNSTFVAPTRISPVPSQDNNKDVFVLVKISYLWYSTIGFIFTLVLIFLAVILTGWKNNEIPEDSICLSPVTRLWMKQKISLKTKELKYEKENNDIITSTSRM